MCMDGREYVRVIALGVGASDTLAAPCVQQEQRGRSGALTFRGHEFEADKHIGEVTTATEQSRGAECRRGGVASEERGAHRHH